MATAAQYQGTGKRKTSIARVILRPGDGPTWINGRTLEDYFPRSTHRTTVLAPLKVAGAESTYDLRVRVEGGGPTGQAGAIRHGIARALVEVIRSCARGLKREGLPTRDARKASARRRASKQGMQSAAVQQALTELYSVVRLDEVEALPTFGELKWKPLRRPLGVTAFGVNAYWARVTRGRADRGARRARRGRRQTRGAVRRESGGWARFIVAGDEFEAPTGTVVFVP